MKRNAFGIHSENMITIVTLTGGPCAIKTTAKAHISQVFRDRGFLVLTVPEAATIAILGGIGPMDSDIGLEIGQTGIAMIARHLEDTFLHVAKMRKTQKPVLIVLDRSIPDGLGYMPARLYRKILGNMGMDPVRTRDTRSKAVLHLRTAALGAEKFYTLANNQARHETLEEARVLDQKILDAWTGHPHLRIIDNSTDAHGKLRRIEREMCQVLGIPVPVEDERKFLVEFKRRNLPKSAQRIDISQFYVGQGGTMRLRSRGQDGHFAFFKTCKQPVPKSKSKKFEVEDFTTQREYEFGKELIEPGTGIVVKDRTCFVYAEQYFELDVFGHRKALPEGDGLLEIERTENSSPKLAFPPYIKVIREVTGDPYFSNYEIAKRIAN